MSIQRSKRRALASFGAFVTIASVTLVGFEYSFGESPSMMMSSMSGADKPQTSEKVKASATTQPGEKVYEHKPPSTVFDAGVREPFTRSATPAEAAAQFDRIILESAGAKNLKPAPLIGDEAFLRRVSIDLLGRVPTAEERRAFLADKAANRRTKLVQSMIKSGRFVDRFTVFFGDLLRIRTTQDGGPQLRAFVEESLRTKMPYDQMVRELLTAKGQLSNKAVGFLVAEEGNALAMPGIVSQEFMGVRMACAQCHDHPFDSWTQEEYYGFAAYFGRASMLRREPPYHGARIVMTDVSSVSWPTKLMKDHPNPRVATAWPIGMLADKDQIVLAMEDFRTQSAKKTAKSNNDVDDLGDVTVEKGDPRLDPDMKVQAQAPAARDPDRDKLADLVTSPRNRYFAWNIVNRLWAEMMGHGIVEPIDDFRSDNEPSNPKLLNRLADEFVASGYDLRFIIEAIVETDAYQRAHAAGGSSDRLPSERAFVASPLRRMNAEAIYDSLVTAGHLQNRKYLPGEHMVETLVTIQERKPRVTVGKDANGKDAQNPMMMSTKVVSSAYSAEEIQDEVNAALAQVPDQMGMTDVDDFEKEALESEAIAKMAQDNADYVTRQVKEMVDDNPKFVPAIEVESPAPSDHMFRQFGQPSRATLDEPRDCRPNTRQALILINGKLVNHAASVGELEPIYRYMDKAYPVEEAINLSYIEVLSRKPTAAEVASATAIVNAAGSRREGIADLRWVLMNCMEFRYLP